MDREAIVEYGEMVMELGVERTEHFRVWMGQMILFCEAQDARLR